MHPAGRWPIVLASHLWSVCRKYENVRVPPCFHLRTKLNLPGAATTAAGQAHSGTHVRTASRQERSQPRQIPRGVVLRIVERGHQKAAVHRRVKRGLHPEDREQSLVLVRWVGCECCACCSCRCVSANG